MNSTPCFELARAAAGAHYLQKRRATLGISTAPRGDGSCRGDTSVWHSAVRGFSRAARVRRVRFPEHGTHCGTGWCLRQVSHGAYCRSAPAFPLATSTKVLLLSGCPLPSSPPASPPPPSSSSSASQVSVPALVLVDDVPAAAQLLPHVGHLLAQGLVLPLQEGGAHRDLVLLQPPRVSGALRRLVVLHAPAPVLVVLHDDGGDGRLGCVGGRGERGETNGKEWHEKGQIENMVEKGNEAAD